VKHTCPRPDHGTAILSGGPAIYWCPITGHNVPDADLDHEFRPAGVTR
jgi:hypothetical protein